MPEGTINERMNESTTATTIRRLAPKDNEVLSKEQGYSRRISTTAIISRSKYLILMDPGIKISSVTSVTPVVPAIALIAKCLESRERDLEKS